jgi:hypothetical protein
LSFPHRWKRLRTDQLALFAMGSNRGAVLAVDSSGHSETRTLQLPSAHGCVRLPEREARENIRAASDGRKRHVSLEGLVHPVEGLR